MCQVHRAVTKRGEKVAVKIQYPAIRTAIENDIKLLRSATLPGRLTGHTPVSIIEEMQRGFLEETDYIQEGKNIDYFRDRLAVLSHVTLPTVHWDLTTDRVLTMSFVEGDTVAKFLASKPVRDLIGHRLFELYHFQLQSCEAIHADHHPGNYLFRPDGSIGLVDFGCVKRVSADISELGRCCVHHSWRQGAEQAQRVNDIIWGPQVHRANARRMLSGLDELMSLVFPTADANGTLVDFGQPLLLDTLFRIWRKALRNKLTNPEFAFITRAELGLYNLLHHLGAKVNTREAWNQDVRARSQPKTGENIPNTHYEKAQSPHHRSLCDAPHRLHSICPSVLHGQRPRGTITTSYTDDDPDPVVTTSQITTNKTSITVQSAIIYESALRRPDDESNRDPRGSQQLGRIAVHRGAV